MIKRKLKNCSDCNTPSYLFGHGRCLQCYKIWKNYKIPKVSENEKERLAKYKVLKEQYKKTHKVCEVCGSDKNLTIHHKSGRIGDNLFKNFLLCCINCHRTIEMNPEEAKEKDYSIIRTN